ncbi:hypothetical protein DDI_2009 [Dickeya dianthicola RNS04.9]|nr:hypothetical protein DDI_2009 [Dickeya dianthicola RNS04.9]
MTLEGVLSRTRQSVETVLFADQFLTVKRYSGVYKKEGVNGTDCRCQL